jgi:hypothetical protein
MAVVVGLILELLGIASVHTWLWLIDWNINKRKSDPEALAVIAAFLGYLYLIATIGLTVMLDLSWLSHLFTGDLSHSLNRWRSQSHFDCTTGAAGKCCPTGIE